MTAEPISWIYVPEGSPLVRGPAGAYARVVDVVAWLDANGGDEFARALEKVLDAEPRQE